MSQSIFLLQTMTLTWTLRGSAYLEGDWIFSSDLAQHQLTKHPENNRPNCESFILGEEGRANGMAQSGEVCHLHHLPSLPDSPGCKSQRTVCPLGSHPAVVVHLNPAASCFPAPFLVPPFPHTSPVCLAFPPPISSAAMTSLKEICRGLPLNPLPENKGRRKGIPHAPVRTPNLTAREKKVTWGFTGPHFL